MHLNLSKWAVVAAVSALLIPTSLCAQSIPSAGRPQSRNSNPPPKTANRNQDDALRKGITEVSRRVGTTDASLKRLESKLQKMQTGELQEILDRLVGLEEMMREAKANSTNSPEVDAGLAPVRQVIIDGDIDRFKDLLDAYGKQEMERAVAEHWKNVIQQVDTNPTLPFAEKEELLINFLGTYEKYPEGPLAKARLTKLYDDQKRLVASTPWVAGASSRILLERAEGTVSVAFSSDGSQLAVGGGDGKIILVNSVTGRQLLQLKTSVANTVRQNPVATVQFSPDGKWLLSAHADGAARIWNLRNGSEEKVLSGHRKGLASARFSPDGKKIVTASHDTSVKLWDVQSGKEEKTLLAAHECSIGPKKGEEGMWSAGCVRYLVSRPQMSGAAFSPDGLAVAIANAASTQVIEVTTNRLLGEIVGSLDAQFNPDGQRLSTLASNQMLLWNRQTNRKICSSSSVSVSGKVAISPTGRHFALATSDNLVVVLSDSCQTLVQLEGHAFPVTSLAFSPDGKRVVSVGGDGRVIIWEDRSVADVQ